MSKQTSKAKTSEKKINSSSSPEEVASFFGKEIKIYQEEQNIIKKQELSGDILLSLEAEDYRKLGIKLGPKKKIQKYLSENKADFPEKEIDVKLSENSTQEEVRDFLEKYIGIEKDMELKGKDLLELTFDQIDKLELSYGKKKKLEKYIKYFNSIKSEKTELAEEKKKEEEKPKEEEKQEGEEKKEE